MQQVSAQAYNQSQIFGDNPKETVSKSLLEAARRMTDIVAAPDDDDQFDSALLLNLRLWSMIAADILSPENTMPPELKSNLLSLHRFVDNHTLDVLSDRDPSKLEVLININRNISAGITSGVAGEEVVSEGTE